MRLGKLILILALALGAASLSGLFGPSAALAQSQPNYGPNGPVTGDTFGKPPSGSAAARRGARIGRYYHHRHYRPY